MKKKTTITLTIASLMIILDSFGAGHALTAFVLTGVIPGTNVTINATIMMMIYALLGGFIFARLAGSSRRSVPATHLA